MTCGFCASKTHERPACPVEPVWLKNIERLKGKA
jgi:hypothetical protein